MNPSNTSNGANIGDFFLLDKGRNTGRFRNSSALSESELPLPSPVEMAHNLNVTSCPDGISSSMDEGSYGSRNRNKDFKQRDLDCAPEISMASKSSGLSALTLNHNNPLDQSSMLLFNRNSSSKVISSGCLPDFLVKLLNCSGWKEEFQFSTGSHVYTSPSGQSYSSISEVFDAFVRGTCSNSRGYCNGNLAMLSGTAVTETKNERDENMVSSPSTENLVSIMNSEEPILKDMTSSEQMALSSEDDLESVLIDKVKHLEDELSHIDPIGCPTEENGNDVSHDTAPSTINNRMGYKTVSTPTVNVLQEIGKTYIRDENSKNNIQYASFSYNHVKKSKPVGIPLHSDTKTNLVHRVSAKGEPGNKPAADENETKPCEPEVVLALPCFNSRCFKNEATRMGSNSQYQHGDIVGARSDIIKGNNIDDTTDFGVLNFNVLDSDRSRKLRLSNMKRRPVRRLASSTESRGASTAEWDNEKALTPVYVLEVDTLPCYDNRCLKGKSKSFDRGSFVLPSSKSRCLKGKSPGFDCGSFDLPNQPNTTAMNHQDDTYGARGSNHIKGKHVPVDDGSEKQLQADNEHSQLTRTNCQQFAFQIHGSDESANANAKATALAPVCVLDEETFPSLGSRCSNGKPTNLDCHSYVPASQPNTTTTHKKGSIFGSRRSDGTKEKLIPVDEGSYGTKGKLIPVDEGPDSEDIYVGRNIECEKKWSGTDDSSIKPSRLTSDSIFAPCLLNPSSRFTKDASQESYKPIKKPSFLPNSQTDTHFNVSHRRTLEISAVGNTPRQSPCTFPGKHARETSFTSANPLQDNDFESSKIFNNTWLYSCKKKP